MKLFKSIKIIDSGKAIILSHKDGSQIRYHSTWLRDNSNDPETRDKKVPVVDFIDLRPNLMNTALAPKPIEANNAKTTIIKKNSLAYTDG